MVWSTFSEKWLQNAIKGTVMLLITIKLKSSTKYHCLNYIHSSGNIATNNNPHVIMLLFMYSKFVFVFVCTKWELHFSDSKYSKDK